MQRAYFDFKQNRSYMAFDNKTDNIIVVWPSIEEGKFYVQFLAEDDNVFEHNEKTSHETRRPCRARQVQIQAIDKKWWMEIVAVRSVGGESLHRELTARNDESPHVGTWGLSKKSRQRNARASLSMP